MTGFEIVGNGCFASTLLTLFRTQDQCQTYLLKAIHIFLNKFWSCRRILESHDIQGFPYMKTSFIDM